MKGDMMLFLRSFLLFLALSGPVRSDTMQWATAIELVRESFLEYCQYARALQGDCFAGAMYNELGYQRHTCAIISRMLDIEEHRDRLEELVAPPLDGSTTGHEAAIHAATLDAWISAAERLVGQSEAYKISVWNLDCVGNYGIPEGDFLENSAPEAEFEVKEGNLYIYGDIDDGFFRRFVLFLDDAPYFETVYLGSGGGSVRDAIQSGRLIRDLGLNTSIFGNCFSACPLVFAGGINRVIWANESRLGFHQISRYGTPIPFDDPAYAIVMSYLYEMGVDGYLVLNWMLQMEPRGMLIVEANDLCPSRIATFIQRVCY